MAGISWRDSRLLRGFSIGDDGFVLCLMKSMTFCLPWVLVNKPLL